MKKIFLIITSCVSVLIIGLLIATNFIFITEHISTKQPDSINIYKNSIAALNNKSYTSSDSEFFDINASVENVGKISIFDRLISGARLNDEITQSGDDEYSNVITDVKKSNYCVEYIYTTNQDKIIHIDGQTKVISYNRLLYVLPKSNGVNKVIVYFANDKGYENYNPLVMNGKTEEIIKLIDSL